MEVSFLILRGGDDITIHKSVSLLLINGRRIAGSPVGAIGQSNFFDGSVFPLSSMQRIEVLKRGASSAHGADAIGGVINILGDNNFAGLQLGGRYGFANHNAITDDSYNF